MKTKTAQTDNKTDHARELEKKVLKKIGKIEGFHKIRASNVFSNCWRVDIWCSHEPKDEECIMPIVSIEYSYIITLNKNNRIAKSDPKIGVRFDERNSVFA